MPTRSLYADIDIPNVDIWGFLFERWNRDFPHDKVIFFDPNTGRSYTYAQVRDTAIEFGKGLAGSWKWGECDVIVLFAANSIDTPAVIWGTLWAGGIVSPANPGYKAEELAFQLNDSTAKALVTQKPLLDVACKAAKIAGIGEERIILIDGQDEDTPFKNFTSVRNNSQKSRYGRAKMDPKKDIAFLVYSSGTTGYPKGVLLSHENIVANVLMLDVAEGGNLGWKGNLDNRSDRILSFLPFYHIYGLTSLVHQAMYTGFELIVMSKFDLETFCLYIQKFKVTFVYVVPPVVLLLAKSPVVNKYDLSSLRMMHSGAAPLTKELVNTVYKRLKIPIKQGYGLSEASPATHVQPWERWNTAIGSVGVLLPNQIAKYMSEDGTELPPGQIGELWVKGPNVFQGYLNNKEETENSLTPDGYLKTGDVGYQDEEGNFYITDRLKELIKYKGFQVPPAELEGLLSCHPDVEDVAVIGIYIREEATEVPRAYVVPKRGIERTVETEQRITAWLAQRVANHKRLRGGVAFVDEIPKSASGKILRRALKVHALREGNRASKAKL